MTDSDKFLSRWSRLKREANAAPVPERAPDSLGQGSDVASSTPSKPDAAEDQRIDLSSLPPIDSIDANADITLFLRPGVPEEVTRAALRRAWSTDPAIRDFVGLVENGWDFNDPNAMAGFGAIDPVDVARLMAQVVCEMPQKDSKPTEPSAEMASKASDVLAGSDEQHQPEVHCEIDGAVRDAKQIDPPTVKED